MEERKITDLGAENLLTQRQFEISKLANELRATSLVTSPITYWLIAEERRGDSNFCEPVYSL